ncbi:hypothetical protein HUG10_08160 [Halorarum halophilum]|uniref:Uncharacterized protein n=1 Tax=Halorarum halophilum TaxID=2743090 RepID=A0A7D5GKT6_9EURY|nr:hypothetical protein [Halobaculum halophilum]QLG27527.1 hypothetical protein HUG10_08160 [Halobaculum halophilum]
MPSETLSVVLNRRRLNEADAPASFTADGPFTVVLDNQGKAVHVHLRFRDRLADLTAVGETNHYVEEGRTSRVHVDVADVDEPVSGTLELITGHGADGTGVEITLVPRERPKSVDVDESLSHPGGSAVDEGESDEEDDPATIVGSVDPPDADSVTLLVAGFAVLALLLAALAAMLLDSLVVMLGLFAVVLSVGAAVYVLRS